MLAVIFNCYKSQHLSPKNSQIVLNKVSNLKPKIDFYLQNTRFRLLCFLNNRSTNAPPPQWHQGRDRFFLVCTVSLHPGAGQVQERHGLFLSKYEVRPGVGQIKPQVWYWTYFQKELDLTFNNVKPKDWYFVIDLVQFRIELGCVRLTNKIFGWRDQGHHSWYPVLLKFRVD